MSGTSRRPHGRGGRGRVRTVLTLLTALGASALLAAPLSAQTLNFNALAALDPSAGINYVDNCYVESGFQIQAVGDPCGTPASLATYTPVDPTGYLGSPALFSTFQASVLFTRVGGGAFSFTSIGLAPFLLGPLSTSPIAVTFTGTQVVGGPVTQSLTLPAGLTALQTVALIGFTNVTSVQLAVTSPAFEPYVQFDNVAVAAVPEPATVTLVAFGLAGVAAAARRRRVRSALRLSDSLETL